MTKQAINAIRIIPMCNNFSWNDISYIPLTVLTANILVIHCLRSDNPTASARCTTPYWPPPSTLTKVRFCRGKVNRSGFCCWTMFWSWISVMVMKYSCNSMGTSFLLLLHKINRSWLEGVASLSVYQEGLSLDFRSFWSSFRCRRKPEYPEKNRAKASLDWKPSAHKCRDRGSNPWLIGAKQGKIRCVKLLPLSFNMLLTVPIFG